MRTAIRGGVALLALVVMAWLGWTIVQVTRADASVATHPEATLRIDPDHPQALLRLAREQLRNQQFEQAAATAQHLLRVEPGQGDAFAVIALAAVGRKDGDADRLLQLALQRAPRSLAVRTQAMVASLTSGDQVEAMRQLDAMLRLSPKRGQILFPAMAQQTMVPAFEQALVETLTRAPPWKRGFMKVLGAEAQAEAMDRIYADLREHGALDEADTRRWIDRQMADGRWHDAYASWRGTLSATEQPVPALFNGGFESDPTGIGFDWRRSGGKGVFTTFEDENVGAGSGRVAHFRFIGRPVANGNLRHALMLEPGRYRMKLQARAEFLHSDRGLEWQLRCAGGPVIATLGPMEGSFEWRAMAVEFQVPPRRCTGQWLQLVNPATKGSAQQVAGDLWIDDIEIAPWQ